MEHMHYMVFQNDRITQGSWRVWLTSGSAANAMRKELDRAANALV